MKHYLMCAAAALVLAACSQSDETAASLDATGSAPSDEAIEVAQIEAIPGDDALRQAIRDDYSAHLAGLYQHFHANPELSFMEVETAARLAEELRALGFEVTEQVGGTGIVAVMRNGEGPTVMLRADMDGLPVQEQSGVSYASRIIAANRFGEDQPVMHACAHDTHMTALVGAARQLSCSS